MGAWVCACVCGLEKTCGIVTKKHNLEGHCHRFELQGAAGLDNTVIPLLVKLRQEDGKIGACLEYRVKSETLCKCIMCICNYVFKRMLTAESDAPTGLLHLRL